MSGERCERVGKWFGCQFQARYNYGAPVVAAIQAMPALQSFILTLTDVRALETLRSRTYIRDICIRCGKTVERSSP